LIVSESYYEMHGSPTAYLAVFLSIHSTYRPDTKSNT
jgi:hypothetical protein